MTSNNCLLLRLLTSLSPISPRSDERAVAEAAQLESLRIYEEDANNNDHDHGNGNGVNHTETSMSPLAPAATSNVASINDNTIA